MLELREFGVLVNLSIVETYEENMKTSTCSIFGEMCAVHVAMYRP